jgi:spoIIIJ-associated protein
MKETQEFTGKDVDTAVKNACSALGVSKGKLVYQVLSAGASGIFGIVGRKDAKIKVTLPDTDAASAEEREGIRSFVDEAFGEDTRLETDPPPAPKPKPEAKAKPEAKPKPEAKAKPEAKPEAKPKPAPKAKPAAKAEVKTEAAPCTMPDPVSDQIPESADDNNGKWELEPEPQEAALPKEILPPVDVTQESIDLGKEALQKMADLITDDATVEAETEEDRLTLKITGGNAGILIGRKGQTLDAMQFLTDKIINRKSEDRVRVKVDIEGYMETRKTNLKHLAYKMAEKAKKTGRPTTINQMSAQDRRIVHLALKDDAQVRTQSMGDGYYRRLVIFPKKKNSFKGKRRLRKQT